MNEIFMNNALIRGFAASVRLEPRPIFCGGVEKTQTERMQLLSVYSSVSVSLSVLLSYWGV